MASPKSSTGSSSSRPITPLVIPTSSSGLRPSGPGARSPSGNTLPSSHGGTPQSAIISVPADWSNSASSSRASMDEDMYRGPLEPPMPTSASSSSSSSQALFDWPQNPGPYANHLRRDPFDTSDPFDPPGSSSEEDIRGYQYAGRRGSAFRSTTDPIVHDGQAVDSEFAGMGPSAVEGYNFEAPPTFNRTFSSPLPNRMGYLKHPLSPVYHDLGAAHSPFVMTPSDSPVTAKPMPATPLHTVSLELADSLQSAIQTLLHLAPPHLLDNAKEQYSGCTVQVPATSLSALLTSMRGLNFLSANAETLAEGRDHGPVMRKGEDFDIGELLQNVADMLSGQASQQSVDFVLFHGDVGIKHVSVDGDVEGLSYTLGHIIRQILLVANRNDTIELGLQVIPQSPSLTPRVGEPLASTELDRNQKSASSSRSNSPGKTSLHAPSALDQGPLLCVFEIVHNIAAGSDESTHVTPKAELNPFTRLAEQSEATKPNFDTTLCRRLIQAQNAVFRVDIQPSSPSGSGLPRRAYELSVLLPRGKPIIEPTQLSHEEEAVRQPFSTVKLAREPTLAELSEFAESLRSKKVSIHANLSSVFARHLTSYLAAWGMDISHIPIDGDEADGLKPIAQTGRHDSGYGGSTAGSTPSAEVPVQAALPPLCDQGRFVIVDDDIAVLRRELFRMRAELHPLSLKPRLVKRPTMTARTRSTPLVRAPTPKPQSAVLIHFTSLAKYNQVRDVVSSFVGSPWSTGSGAYLHPEVMVIPKPVGPRRFLTALHTAVNQPIVDPFFSPIATSPRSPGGGYFAAGSRTPTERETGFFDSVAEETESSEPQQAKPRSPLGEHPPSAAHLVRTKEGMHLSLPTPADILATPASEYFSSASKASSSGASGVVMQSPDGRPFGMFFEPPVKNERRTSLQRLPTDSIRRKSSTSRRASNGGEETGPSPQSGSPSSSRRVSAASTIAPVEERQGSANERPNNARMASRRRTLPLADSPIIAVGRDRSATITGQRRNTPGTSPTVSSPRTDQGGFPKKSAVPTPAPVEETAPAPPAKPDKPAPRSVKKPAVKDDVVVPPINVLIVEGERGGMRISLTVR
ncbi:hypothetical protein IAU60_002271 [Kwoniella sp. DSM 27419]